jgi:outer membrane protein TolC
VVASTLIASPVTIWSLGNSILAPIFDGGRLQAGQEEAAAARDSSAFAYRKAALTAFGEVEDQLVAVQKTDHQERTLETERDILARTLRQATSRYRAGYSPYLDQLDAQRTLLGTELKLAQSRADRLTSTVKLYQALGGGWQGEAEGEVRR